MSIESDALSRPLFKKRAVFGRKFYGLNGETERKMATFWVHFNYSYILLILPRFIITFFYFKVV